ncbi:DUF4097 family beta strand repeat-containing protein [Staphylococcus simulans]|uniref:DUF4097 family beta strand repeat-containing protein n=1 Tax=Staphylococcus simulans TaxID=1286 RepID=UPI00399B1592
MRKALLIIFSIGLVITVGFGIAGYVEGKKQLKNHGTPIHYTKDYKQEDAKIKNLKINSDTSNVVIKKGDHFSVEGSGGVKGKTEVKSALENDTLVVESKLPNPTINFTFGNIKQATITITVPERQLSDVTIYNDTGDMTIEGLKANQLESQQDTGDLLLKTSDIHTLNLKSDTGDIKVTDTQFKNMKSENDTGDTEIKGIKGDVNLQAKSDTGDIKVEYAQAPKHTKLIHDGDADIEIHQPNLKEKRYGNATHTLELESDTGTVEVN